jgi:hypothetical protein
LRGAIDRGTPIPKIAEAKRSLKAADAESPENAPTKLRGAIKAAAREWIE